MHKSKFLPISIILVMLLALAGPFVDVSASPLGQTAPGLGAATSFSILSATGVTNVGASSTSGDVGVSPGPSCVPPVGLTIAGAPHFCDPLAASAQVDADIARIALEGQGPGTILASGDLSGQDLVAGVYTVPGANVLPGTLTLRGPGVFIFLTNGLAVGGNVSMLDGADPCNVFWRDASSMTFTANASFVGTIVALTSITMANGVSLNGRAIAQNGNVTLDANTIFGPVCALPEDEDEDEEDNSVNRLPNTGGAPIRTEDFPWSVVIVAAFSAVALALGVRTYRRTHLPKK